VLVRTGMAADLDSLPATRRPDLVVDGVGDLLDLL
jgi:hypothetical protein